MLCGSVVKNLPANAGDLGLIPGSGRSPGEGNANPLPSSYMQALVLLHQGGKCQTVVVVKLQSSVRNPSV